MLIRPYRFETRGEIIRTKERERETRGRERRVYSRAGSKWKFFQLNESLLEATSIVRALWRKRVALKVSQAIPFGLWRI